MKGSTLRQLSANGLQLVLNQLFSIAIFYILSVCLSKTDFGRINLAFAVLLGLFGALSFGLDSLVVKKTAAGANRRLLLRAYLFHVLVTGLPACALLWIASPWLPRSIFLLLPLTGLGKFFIFLSTPFKQITSGRERFNVLARMSLVSNGLRCAGLLVLVFSGSFTLPLAVLVFIAGDLAELIACVVLYRSGEVRADAKQPGSSRYTQRQEIKSASLPAEWRLLALEASPQAAVVVIASLLSRFDWICIGFLSKASALAEYSFAYKVFEMAQMPLLIIAPLLLPRFTRVFGRGGRTAGQLSSLLHPELFVAAASALLLQAAWVPLIDRLTAGRYGAVNRQTITLLCCSLPLIYINNFLWTAWFAMGRMKPILYSFIITACANIAGCLLLIPRFGNAGAAAAWLISMSAQTLFYLGYKPVPEFAPAWKMLFQYGSCVFVAACCGRLFTAWYNEIFFSVITYLFLCACFTPLPGRFVKNLREAGRRYATRQPVSP